MRHLILLALAASLTACVSAKMAVKENTTFAKYDTVYLPAFEKDPRDVLPKVHSRFEKMGFRVHVVGDGEAIGGRQGTGSIITADGYVLTSGHVIGKEKTATVWLNGKRYAAQVVHVETPDLEESERIKALRKSTDVKDALEASVNSKDNRPADEAISPDDFALLKIDSGGPLVPVPIATAPDYRMGEDVFTLGFPLSNILGNKPRLTKGLISSTVGPRDNADFVQVSVEIQPGNSGGPLLDEKGQLIGVIQMTLNAMSVMARTGGTAPQNVNFAVKYAPIERFLARVPGTVKLALRTTGTTSFADIQDSIVQVRSGTVTEEFEKQPKLVCITNYSSLWDMWYRFSYLDLTLFDYDSEQALLRVGQYGDSPFSTEDSTLDEVFKEMQTKLRHQ